MPREQIGIPFRLPCDPRDPGRSLWCGDDAPLSFDYLEPTALCEAVTALEEVRGEARIIAGGQSLLPALRSGMMRTTRLISLRRIPELRLIQLRAHENTLSIGAEATFTAFLQSPHAERLPLLQQALSAVGNHTIRNRTTFGGTVAWSNPMAALLLALAMLDARVVTTRRQLISTECSAGPLRNNFFPDEIVVSIEVPMPRPSLRFGFHKTTARASGGKALASMAVALDCRGTMPRSVRIGVVGLRDRPWVSVWHPCEMDRSAGDVTDALMTQAPVEAPFDPLLPSPTYVKSSAQMVCRRLATELDHA